MERDPLVAAGHVTTQNLAGRKICWKGGATGFSSRPNVLEYPLTPRFWRDRWSRDQPQPESVPTTKGLFIWSRVAETTLPPSYPVRDIFPLICLKNYINRLEVGETTRGGELSRLSR